MNDDMPIDLISLSRKLTDMKKTFSNNNVIGAPSETVDFAPPPIPTGYTDINGYTIIEGAAPAAPVSGGAGVAAAAAPAAPTSAPTPAPTAAPTPAPTSAPTPTPIAASTATQVYVYNGLTNENIHLQDKIKDMTSDFSTYEQQVVYQQQQLDNLMTVNFWMWITYYFKVCVLIYYLFWVNTDMYLSTKIIFTVASIFYPYLINIGQEYGYDIWKYSWSVINVDVYSQDR